ncbi:MAG TPA: CidA/LrgA family protein [Firmicutes bacterium]|nr:CidA/LrgA family protein [Bacillota bacterium]
MKYMKQMCLILFIWAIGEYLSMWLSPIFFIPGNILGMFILFTCLLTEVIKESQIKELSQFFLDHMALFFIPLAVNLVAQTINGDWALLFIITLIVTPIVMVSTTFVTDKLMSMSKKGGQKHV